MGRTYRYNSAQYDSSLLLAHHALPGVASSFVLVVCDFLIYFLHRRAIRDNPAQDYILVLISHRFRKMVVEFGLDFFQHQASCLDPLEIDVNEDEDVPGGVDSVCLPADAVEHVRGNERL